MIRGETDESIETFVELSKGEDFELRLDESSSGETERFVDLLHSSDERSENLQFLEADLLRSETSGSIPGFLSQRSRRTDNERIGSGDGDSCSRQL